MNADTLKKCAESALDCGARVVSFEFKNKLYWAKQKKERGLILRMHKGSATQLFQQEISNLKGFAEAGMRVPPLVFENEKYFVTEDIGKSLEEKIRTSDDYSNLIKQAAAGVADLHSSGLAHGGLHMRNMTVHTQNVGFLDLENACIAEASITSQAYDLIVFVWSTFSIDLGAAPMLVKARNRYLSKGGSAWPEAVKWCENRAWFRPASAPLRWHERRYKKECRYQRYAAVPLVLDFFTG